jgi:hypothetical protein
MNVLLAAVLAASPLVMQPTYYVARVATFGCTSMEAVSSLRSLRPHSKEFRRELLAQIFQGECVEIAKGKLVQGVIDVDDASMLTLDRQIVPPGYLAPARDFKASLRPR